VSWPTISRQRADATTNRGDYIMVIAAKSRLVRKNRAAQLNFSNKPIWYYFEKAETQRDYQSQLGHHYLQAKNHNLSTANKVKFRAWIRELGEKVDLKTVYVSGQPYLSFEEMERQVKKTGILEISTDFNDPAVLTPGENLIYRKIHDMHHLQLGADFSWEGELKTCHHFCTLTNDPLFHRILFSESVLQVASSFVLGDFPDFQKLVLTLPD
jgi:hypothetical protein